MTDVKLTWQGSSKILDVTRARLLAPWYVAEYRLRNMSKWFAAIIAFGLGNPVLVAITQDPQLASVAVYGFFLCVIALTPLVSDFRPLRRLLAG
jgi:hypothetical protein